MKVIFKNGLIEDQKADVLVNAADSYLWFGTGVDGALRQRGGWDYIHACQQISKKHSPIPAGEVIFMLNPSRHLKCKYVAHAVSPSTKDREPYLMLYLLVRSILKKSKKLGMNRIRIPLLGTGAFGLNINKAYHIINTAAKYTPEKGTVLIIHPDFTPKVSRTKVKLKGELKWQNRKRS